jgi:hypothetical protein
LYEHKKARLLTKREFTIRVVRHLYLALAAFGFALGLGVMGYHHYANLNWTDSLLNASMILGGMGPVDTLPDDAAKIFASMYALFSGLVFIGVTGVLFAPFLHRIMHHLHVVDDSESD